MRSLILKFILISILLSTHTQASPENPCNDILLNQFETTVRDLAKMRFDLDLRLSQGKESLVTRSLIIAFEHKQIEALNAFSSNGLTSTELKEKVQIAIKKIQGDYAENINLKEMMQQTQAHELQNTSVELTQFGKLAIPTSQAAQTLLANGKILVVGGRKKDDGTGTRSVQLFDPATQKTTLILELAHARLDAKIWVLTDGTILVAGGGSEEIELISADLKTVSVIATGGPRLVLNKSQEGFLNDGSLLIVSERNYGSQFIVGESNYRHSLKTYLFSQFNPISKELKELGRINGFEEGKGLSIFPDGTVIMSGGLQKAIPASKHESESAGAVSLIESVNAFAIKTPPKGWLSVIRKPVLKYEVEVIGDIRKEFFYHQQIVLNDGRILIVGGVDTSFQEVSEVGIFNPTDNSYREIGSLEIARTGHTLTLLSDGRVLVTGGVSDWQAVKEVEMIDPEFETIETVASLTEGRKFPAVTVIAEKEVVVIGGVKNIFLNALNLSSGTNTELIEKLKVGRR